MKINYHKRSFQLIDDEACFSDENIRKIEAFENDYQIQLPPSLREWYSIENHQDVLQGLIDRTLNHTVISLEDSRKFGSLVKTVQQSDRLLYLLEENQGCFHMAIKLTGSDNTPVMFRHNEVGAIWKLHARSFSDWILAITWDSANWKRCSPCPTASALRDFVSQATELGPETYEANMWLYASKFVRVLHDGMRHPFFID